MRLRWGLVLVHVPLVKHNMAHQVSVAIRFHVCYCNARFCEVAYLSRADQPSLGSS